jgi:serine/threonine-protein kinase RsbW
MVIEHNLPLGLKEVPGLIQSVMRKLEPLKIDSDILFKIKLSLEEALVNAVKHGNKQNKDKRVLLKIRAYPEFLEAEIKDEGQGFDYTKIPLPTEEKNLERASGRGIFLIRRLMDKVEFLDQGSRIKFIKYLKKNNTRTY